MDKAVESPTRPLSDEMLVDNYPKNFNDGRHISKDGQPLPLPHEAHEDVISGYLAEESNAIGHASTGQVWKIVPALDAAARDERGLDRLDHESFVRRAAILIGIEFGIQDQIETELRSAYNEVD